MQHTLGAGNHRESPRIVQWVRLSPRKDWGPDSPGARIAAVADGYSALTRWRPHRAPGNRDAALGTLHQAAGAGRYDPRVVQALGDLLAGKENGGSSAQIAAGA